MADLRVTGGPPATALEPARPTEATRAAQRAFFQAALNATAPAAPARPVEARPTPQAAAIRTSQPALSAEAARYLRPGSLLDIKV